MTTFGVLCWSFCRHSGTEQLLVFSLVYAVIVFLVHSSIFPVKFTCIVVGIFIDCKNSQIIHDP